MQNTLRQMINNAMKPVFPLGLQPVWGLESGFLSTGKAPGDGPDLFLYGEEPPAVLLWFRHLR